MIKRFTIYILAISFLIGCSANMKSSMKDAMSMNHESCCCNSDSKSCTMKKKETQKSKKVCFNKLNHKLHISQKKDKLKNTVIICSVFLTIGLLGFIVG